jgi:hypothetical protein
VKITDHCNDEVVFQCLAVAGTVGQLFTAKWITFSSITYRSDQVLLAGTRDGMPVFALLNSIFIDEVHKVNFVVVDFETIVFTQHVHAYEVSDTILKLQCVKPRDLLDQRPLRWHH